MISKSDYMTFLKHPAWLWYLKNDKSKLPEMTVNQQSIIDAGKKFEVYGEQLFSDITVLGFETQEEYQTLPSRTQEAVMGGAQTITQARFVFNDLTCICDVLNRADDGSDSWDLYEIKASSGVKPDHERDLAFQVYVLEKAGLRVRNISVIHINKSYVRRGQILLNDFVTMADITSKVRKKINKTEEEIIAARTILEEAEQPDESPRFARYGALSEWIEIFKHMYPGLPKYSIYDLVSPGTTRIAELEDAGVMLIKDIPESCKLTAKQQGQVAAVKSDKPSIDVPKIRDFMKELEFPLYFLDYETLSDVVPPYVNTKPYQQIPFQYSLHILDSPDAELRHTEYLHTNNENPVESLLQQLIQDVGTKGTVLVWYESFEKNRNIEMGQMFPQYQAAMEALNERVVDLIIPFSKGWYCHKDFAGSASIKYVLPVLVPSLTYKTLGIQEGASAQRIWMQTFMEDKNQEQKTQIINDLIEYCKLDTFAMVEIYRHLKLI